MCKQLERIGSKVPIDRMKILYKIATFLNKILMDNFGTNPFEALKAKLNESDVKLEDILAMDVAVASMRLSDEIIE